MIKWIDKNKRYAVIFIMMIMAFAISAFGMKYEIAQLYNYYSRHSDDVKDVCQNFPYKYENFMSMKITHPNFSSAIAFVENNKEIIDRVLDFEKENSKKPNDLEVRKICTEYYVQFWLGLNGEAFYSAKSNKSIDYLKLYKTKIVVNILASSFAMALLCFIFIRIKNKSEGLFRISVLSIFPIAAIPFLISNYSIIATPETQSITFNASIFLALYLICKIYKWIADGFTKSNVE